MLILPFNDIENTPIDLKYSSIDGIKIRLDRIRIEKSNGIEVLRKTTHFGRCLPFKEGTSHISPWAQLYDFIDIITSIKHGEIVEINSSITNKELANRVPINFIYPKSTSDNFINVQKILSEYKSQKILLRDNIDFMPTIDLFEDNFNISFLETIGPFLAFLSGVTMIAPFQCKIIIDSQLGFAIKDVLVPLQDSDIVPIVRKAIKNLANGIITLHAKFKDTCEKEKRIIRFTIYVTEFGMYIETIDGKYLHERFVINLNNSDHCRMLSYVDATYGPKYGSSELFGSLLDTDCKMLLPTLFETDWRQNEFLKSEYPEVYENAYQNN